MAIKIPFSKIWSNYPDEPPCVDKNGNAPTGWDNQCAVKVGVALQKSGLSFASYPGQRCPGQPKASGMVAKAQALANWLREPKFINCAEPRWLTPAAWEQNVHGRRGIVFFKDYWRRAGETVGNGTGDHIDLWNWDTLTPSLPSILRFRLGISRIPNPFTLGEDNYYSDLSKSTEILFWAVS